MSYLWVALLLLQVIVISIMCFYIVWSILNDTLISPSDEKDDTDN